ncbi:MAG TPA: hypothetical protein VLL52_03930 [Anaerolineae bacterium]|nr:hypothetical protein [Anaerolineae bacterium]
MSMKAQIEQAEDFIAAGQVGKARELLLYVLRVDPDDVYAWQVLAGIVAGEEMTRRCWGQVLRIEPARKRDWQGDLPAEEAAVAVLADLVGGGVVLDQDHFVSAADFEEGLAGIVAEDAVTEEMLAGDEDTVGNSWWQKVRGWFGG